MWDGLSSTPTGDQAFRLGLGRIPEDDWRRTFNLGIGMIFVVSSRRVKEAGKILSELGERWYQIGEVERGRGVTYK